MQVGPASKPSPPEGAGESSVSYGIISSRTPSMISALDVAKALATTKTPILLVGEPGTGRASLAHTIHGTSKLKHLLSMSCIGMGYSEIRAALNPASIGGLCKGSLLLLEVDALSPDAQTILLASLGSGQRFSRGKVLADVPGPRLISTSRRDLRALVQQGRFRVDLCYRLAGAVIQLPPLCRRVEDIPSLVHEFMRQEPPDRPLVVSHDAMDMLQSYSWPGNVPQLRNAIVSAAACTSDGQITERSLNRFLTPVASGTDIDVRVGMSLSAAEKRVILATLGACCGNRQRTADMLGISRRTLYEKLAAYRAVEGTPSDQAG